MKVREKSIPFRNPYPMTRSRALCLPISSETVMMPSAPARATTWIPPVSWWSSEARVCLIRSAIHSDPTEKSDRMFGSFSESM
ncbi:MAG: hypothetical protein BWY93_02105 [Euryarchaeota archaeon ADurb.BinA087]|nr:MAG: hypothetical protein BWY93_02105 [Euryarchaeota archaeon ADurb.BinA087]